MSSSPCLFTGIMACYNVEHYVQQALESVLNQDFNEPFQLIIVDDCSTDSTVEVVKEVLNAYKGHFELLFIRNEMNIGVAGSYNKGMEAARGEWIIDFDADDVYYPLRLQYYREIVERNSGIMLISSAMANVTEDGTCFSYRCYDGRIYHSKEEFPASRRFHGIQTRFEILNRRPGEAACFDTFGTAFAFHRKVFEYFGPLPVSLVRCTQDVALTFRGLLLGDVYGDNRIVVDYRMHGGNLYNRSYSPGMKGIREVEEFWGEAIILEAGNANSNLIDIKKIRKNIDVDFSQEQINILEDLFSRAYTTAMMRYQYWKCNFWEKMSRIRYAYGRTLSYGMSWALWRLMPLTIFVFIKNMKRFLPGH